MEKLFDQQTQELESTRRELEKQVKLTHSRDIIYESQLHNLHGEIRELRKSREIVEAKPKVKIPHHKEKTVVQLTAENQLLKEMLEFSKKSLKKYAQKS